MIRLTENHKHTMDYQNYEKMVKDNKKKLLN